MKEDNIRIRRVLAADVKFLKDHGIMDYSLLLSAERYSANTVKQDDGGVIDPETPTGGGGGSCSINSEIQGVLQGGQSSIKQAQRRRSKGKSFFQRTNSGILQSKDALNEYLRSQSVTEGQFNRHMFLSSNGKWVYHVSIIDYL